jgi:hypothetical protein
MKAILLQAANKYDREAIELIERTASVLTMKPTDVVRNAVREWCPKQIAKKARENDTTPKGESQ